MIVSIKSSSLLSNMAEDTAGKAVAQETQQFVDILKLIANPPNPTLQQLVHF